MLWKCFLGGFSSFAWQRGTLQLIAVHLITLHNILEYMQIAIIQTEAANFVEMNVSFSKLLATTVHTVIPVPLYDLCCLPVLCWIMLVTLTGCVDGVKGSGKTMSLCHTVHYCSTQGWLVLHIPDGNTHTPRHGIHTDTQNNDDDDDNNLLSIAHLWVKNCKELLPSSYHASRFDQPIQASNWLRNFRTTNEHFLSKVVPPPQIDSGCQVHCQSKVWTRCNHHVIT
jgi:hypothetical protein